MMTSSGSPVGRLLERVAELTGLKPRPDWYYHLTGRTFADYLAARMDRIALRNRCRRCGFVEFLEPGGYTESRHFSQLS